MSFQPVVPLGGLAGWGFLKRTEVQQRAAFAESPQLASAAKDFADRIGGVRSAEALVADRRLLSVALGAFGLGDDIENRYFIQRVLGDGIGNPDALANRLSDGRYQALSEAFGFGPDALPRTGTSVFVSRITDAYMKKEFERALGEVAPELRLTLSLDDELGRVLSRNSTPDGDWYTVMGTPPLREVFQTALRLPDSFAALPLDRQLRDFRSRAEAMFGAGEVRQFADPDRLDDLRRAFLAQSSATTPGAASQGPGAALAILQGGGSAPSLLQILASRSA